MTVAFMTQEDFFLPPCFFGACVIVLIVFGEISLSLEKVVLSYRVSPGREGGIIASNPPSLSGHPQSHFQSGEDGGGLR